MEISKRKQVFANLEHQQIVANSCIEVSEMATTEEK